MTRATEQTPEPIRYGNYEVLGVLGRGSMGTVFLARDARIGRRVALKTVELDPHVKHDPETVRDFLNRLKVEAELTGRLIHPNIVTLYEAGLDGTDIRYLAFEYVEGRSLGDLLAEKKPLPVTQALDITEDVLLGLEHAHQKGIIHRDIKPPNILITRDGRAKLADFGIARFEDSNLTAKGSILGTPFYMSPEQAQHEPVTPQSDLFSVGVLLFEMLTATRPFAGKDLITVLHNVVHRETPLVSAVGPVEVPAIDQLVGRLTAKLPRDRYSSAAEVIDEVRAIRTEIQANATAPTPAVAAQSAPKLKTESPLRRPLSPPVFFGAIVAAMLLVAAILFPMWLESSREPVEWHTAEELALFAEKRETLTTAQVLFDQGRYQESLDTYQAYLQHYPWALAASNGTEQAREAMQRRTRTRTRTSASSTTATPAKPEEEKRPSAGQRFRRRLSRIFGRD